MTHLQLIDGNEVFEVMLVSQVELAKKLAIGQVREMLVNDRAPLEATLARVAPFIQIAVLLDATIEELVETLAPFMSQQEIEEAAR